MAVKVKEVSLEDRVKNVKKRLDEIEKRKLSIDARQDKIDVLALDTLVAVDFFAARVNALDCLAAFREIETKRTVVKVVKEETDQSGSSLEFDGSYTTDKG